MEGCAKQMKKMGYIRVSSKDQNLERQLIKMKQLGIEDGYIFADKVSGKDFDREQYQRMKSVIEKNDLILFDSLDRLGRDYDRIISEWKLITRELGADIVCLDNETLFDSRKFKQMGKIGKLMEDQFLSLLSYVAEEERAKIKKRQAEGIAIAKANGKKLGRPTVELDKDKFEFAYKKWRAGEITAVLAMRLCGLSKMTFYRKVKKYEETIASQL